MATFFSRELGGTPVVLRTPYVPPSSIKLLKAKEKHQQPCETLQILNYFSTI